MGLKVEKGKSVLRVFCKNYFLDIYKELLRGNRDKVEFFLKLAYSNSSKLAEIEWVLAAVEKKRLIGISGNEKGRWIEIITSPEKN